MKTKTIFALGILLFMKAIYSQAANSSKLTISIQGMKNKKGSLSIALYKSDTDFNQEKFSYVNKISANSSGVIVFEKIDYGNYGVAVYHDENDNSKLDRNFVGMPTEGYGFSNNVKGSFGPPGFKETSVPMTQPETKLTIKLIY